jgi:hypothetical protein
MESEKNDSDQGFASQAAEKLVSTAEGGPQALKRD